MVKYTTVMRMKNLKDIFIAAVIFMLTSCNISRVDLFEITTSTPNIHIKKGSLSLPCYIGCYDFGDVGVYMSTNNY